MLQVHIVTTKAKSFHIAFAFIFRKKKRFQQAVKSSETIARAPETKTEVICFLLFGKILHQQVVQGIAAGYLVFHFCNGTAQPFNMPYYRPAACFKLLQLCIGYTCAAAKKQ